LNGTNATADGDAADEAGAGDAATGPCDLKRPPQSNQAPNPLLPAQDGEFLSPEAQFLPLAAKGGFDSNTCCCLLASRSSLR